MEETESNPWEANRRNLWFENGCWYYRCPAKLRICEITSLMRKTAYNSASLAAALGVGERSFRRLVKDCLGIPPGLWLRWERAVAARHRLRSGCSVKELAAEYGFRHQGDFCVEFKRWHRVSPNHFVQLAQESACRDES
jgi:AraC-like DNA-binding protein